MSLPEYVMGFSSILIHLQGAVAIVTLNRTKERNTWSKPLVNELVKAFGLLNQDDRIRVVVLTAEPTAPAFCAGADISKGFFNDKTFLEGPHGRWEKKIAASGHSPVVQRIETPQG